MNTILDLASTLSMVLLTLNVLALLFYTVFHLVALPYQQAASRMELEKGFSMIQALSKYFLFDS